MYIYIDIFHFKKELAGGISKGSLNGWILRLGCSLGSTPSARSSSPPCGAPSQIWSAASRVAQKMSENA